MLQSQADSHQRDDDRRERMAQHVLFIQQHGGIVTLTPLCRGSKGKAVMPCGTKFVAVNRHSHSGEAVLQALVEKVKTLTHG